jgi:superfamily II DNA or RNA helicase
LAKAKIEAMLQIVEEYEEQEEPLVVFSAHRAPIDLLEGREGWAVITGDTRPEDRTKIEDAFQRGELRGIACTIKAGGVAITLTRASHALFVDLEWTPALNAQAEDRICRIGQSRGVIITILVADHPLDIRIAQLLAQKRVYIEGSVDAARLVNGVDPEIPVMPEIDFQALAAKAAEEAEKAERALLASKERQALYEAEKAAAQAAKRAIREDLMAPGRRPAKTAREEWAAEALGILAGMDPDRAREQNGIGFNGADGQMGHNLARQVYLGLTEAQWQLALEICPKYWRQVGRPPAEKIES